MAALTTVQRRERDEAVMAHLRATGGFGEGGQRLVILTIRGAQSGLARDKPVCVCEDGADLVVAASAGGQARHPRWFTNLVANPEVTIEYGGRRAEAIATVVENGPERDRLFAMLTEEIDGLYGYQDKCRDTRQIPIVRLRLTA